MPTSKLNEMCSNKIGVICRDFADIDRQAECLSGYDQSYQQLSCGKFVGQFKTAILDSKLGLYFERVNQILDQSGAVPQNSYSVIFLMDEDEPCKINSYTFSANNLWYAGPGSSFNTISIAGTHFGVIDLEKDFFEAIFIANYPEFKNSLTEYSFGILDNSLETARCLRSTINKILFILQSPSQTFSKSLTVKCLRISIAELISDRIYTLLNAFLESGEQRFPDYFKICKCARDYINDHRGIDISLCDLCRQLGVSRRTLEYSFRYSIDQPPAAYLRSIKFNEIRRAFLSPDNAQKSIGDIVANWGIWHLSHFAQYYQKQFNELPSETRKIWQ